MVSETAFLGAFNLNDHAILHHDLHNAETQATQSIGDLLKLIGRGADVPRRIATG